jgi:hypothetical protein
MECEWSASLEHTGVHEQINRSSQPHMKGTKKQTNKMECMGKKLGKAN